MIGDGEDSEVRFDWRRGGAAAAGLLAALVLVAMVFMVAYANADRERALTAERHAYDVALVVRNASSNMSRAEAALARFVLDENQKTSGAIYANDWELAGYQIQQLGKLVRGNPEQVKRVERLQQLYQTRSGELALAARAAIQKQGQSGISYY
jgi:CHASE3 domain sensor protein